METTRHFVATVYVVSDGAVALHEHDKLGMWLPAGGHVDRDELPHEAALRETREELGLDVDLVAPRERVESETVRSIPQPQHFLLEDINVHENGDVGHQHVDFVFYGASDSREIDPGPGEQPAGDWTWFTPAELDERAGELPDDVVEVGKQAVAAVEDR
ncbi:NUDIX hydrolase [Haloarcula litorea]|uniref:NUDIX hydrolase n=1 Tax=Haloarcula litorea TaxID=3032579 RepID=UPI0023E8CC05|nr:NUDIX domain-containing protein [Halomicroarcula sp. GDY20]